MVRTRSAGAVAEDAYSVQLFDHAMAFVPELSMYLDGTAEYAAPGELPVNDLGAMAMTVDAQGKATLRTVPFSQERASRTNHKVPAQLAGKDSVASRPKADASGSLTAGQRRSCESNDPPGCDRTTVAALYPW